MRACRARPRPLRLDRVRLASANREKNREFYKNWAVWRKIARKTAAKSVSCRTIPYKMKLEFASNREFFKPSREFAASYRELPAG
jgi:hypothetical protein